MRVGVDAATWPNARGYGRFTRGLVTALAARPGVHVTLIADAPTALDISPPPNAKLVTVPVATAAAAAASRDGRRSARDLLHMGWATRALSCDVILFPSVYSYFPVIGRTPQVVVIHDAIPERLPTMVFPSWRLRVFWWIKMRWAIAAARRVVAVSPFAARQILRSLPVDARRLRVIHEASDPIFTRSHGVRRLDALATRGLRETPYLLFVGGLSPHKDIPTLFRALAHCNADPTRAPLVLAMVGEHADDRFFTEPERLRDLTETLGIARWVRWLGHVPDEELVALYVGAVALVMPSLAEGFGLPTVEAAACGLPVIASAESGAAELLGDAVLTFPAGDADALADRIRTLRTRRDVAERLAEGAMQRARSMTWDHAAALTDAILREATDS